MKFEPRRSQVLGRIVVQPSKSALKRPDETKDRTKFVLVDAVGADVAGIAVGDVVVPTALNLIVIDDGFLVRPFVDEKNIAFVARDWASLDEFHVQSDNASEYVPFGSPRAARSMGAIAAAPPQESNSHTLLQPPAAPESRSTVAP